MSQNLTLSAKDWRDIERIKPMLLEGKSQLDMSRVLHLRRETVNRKIGRWVQTEDFEVWLKTAWLDKYRNIGDEKAFDALTKLLGKMVTRKAEIKSEHKEEITTHKIEELNVTLEDYRDSVQKVVDRYIRQDSTT